MFVFKTLVAATIRTMGFILVCPFPPSLYNYPLRGNYPEPIIPENCAIVINGMANTIIRITHRTGGGGGGDGLGLSRRILVGGGGGMAVL